MNSMIQLSARSQVASNMRLAVNDHTNIYESKYSSFHENSHINYPDKEPDFIKNSSETSNLEEK